MFSIVNASGRQFIFKPNNWYDLNYIKNTNLGDFILLNKILCIKKLNKIQLGKPFLPESQIIGKIIQEVKGNKITVLKTKPKKNYTRVKGHRQLFTRISIQNKLG
jgi:large subunit ribosomal protein L21